MRLTAAVSTALLCLAANAGAAPGADLTLDRIMADPDWIGPAVETPFWSADGGAVYYQLKRKGSTIRDLHRVNLAGGKDDVLTPAQMADADAAGAVYDATRERAAFVRNGDVFVREIATGRLIQVTRSTPDEASPQFSADDAALQYRVGNDWYAYDFRTGVAGPVAVLKAEKDPAEKKPGEFEEMQLRLIATLKHDYDNKQAQKARNDELRKADPTRASTPYYLGDDVTVADSALSPDGRWLLVATTPKSYEAGRIGKMPVYVTQSGYEEVEDVRTRVGKGDPAPATLWRVDLASHAATKLDLAGLPGIKDDPLAAIRAENEKAAPKNAPVKETGKKQKDKKEEKKESTERTVQLIGMQFARDGATAAVMLKSNDNKDRWLATVTGASGLETRHRLTDPAWINWNFNEFGWLPDNRTVWYVSEESGYAQVYTRKGGDKPLQVTPGKAEYMSPVVSPDGKWFYLRSNAQAPYSYDIYRVPVSGGKPERLTQYEGAEGFALSHDGSRLAVTHSGSYVPMQLSVVDAAGGTPRELTDTRTDEFKAITWQAPQIVPVPSTHVKSPIWGKFYSPQNAAAGKKPIVLFVHGAGYTQNTHLSYPYYFREQMFHNLLTQRGYLVLDLDYRASEGYGRDWRTSIYRQMGHPELEDLIDGVNWLVKEHDGDASRVGVYGGSYGGFMTLMALFRAPDVFRAGAALRPVTDWTQYNHDYTSAILNTPQTDDIAYRRSSPIEFADGLKGHLLIAHGMMDDNVLFQDSVRLFQRLIEMHKDNVELAPYPLERHGFVHADSWRDEYSRILKLFESNLK